MIEWSRSEFLNLIEFRSKYWSFVDLAEHSGFSIAHNDAVIFHAVLEGSVTISYGVGKQISLVAGDIIMFLSGCGHAVRSSGKGMATTFEYLLNGEPTDIPIDFSMGKGKTEARLLCGRLKVRWPGGQPLRGLPTYLHIQSDKSIINLRNLESDARGAGAASTLTRMVNLLFPTEFRKHEEFTQIFESSDSFDPIALVLEYIEQHPLGEWTVDRLAAKVGMGRSNFSARFTARTGRTPMEVVTDERMKQAKALLQKTDFKIATIGKRVGYNSESAFSRRFTRHFGISPGKMRKSCSE